MSTHEFCIIVNASVKINQAKLQRKIRVLCKILSIVCEFAWTVRKLMLNLNKPWDV